MLSARIELRGEELFCADIAEGGASTVRALPSEALARLRGWAERYDAAVRSRALPPLVEIGRDIAGFLDEGDRWLDRVLGGIGEIAFEIAVPGRPEERERVLLDVPWELLAPNGIFLAADNERLVRVTRHLGGTATPVAPAYRDLALLFMAAEIEGQGVLNYEQEEAAILRATKGLDLNLSVEESGAVEFLTQRLAQDGPFEALHLSCHGDIEKGEPILALENPEGGLARTGIAGLSEALGEEGRKPSLVFLSACRTGEHGTAAAAFVQSLVRSGVLNAVGWDGSVYDDDAIAFAEIFYKELAAGRSVAYAAAQGRRALLRAHLAEPSRGRHWHLARVYVGTRGGGPLCAASRPKRPYRRDAGYKEFLDIRQRRVPVATAAEFVGRRRQAQRILRAFRDHEGAGVLIHGIGRQGKSSLAARIANRMPDHDTVVVFERYDALAVFEAVRNALPPRLQGDFDKTWRQQVMNDPSALQNALLDMLEGPLRAVDPATGTKPVLLIVDDLERIIETPKPGDTRTPVMTAYNVALAAIIAGFRDAKTTGSRLLLTSRYTFGLSDARGDDLAARLVAVQLPPMDETQRDKQLRAAAWLTGPSPGAAAVPGAGREVLEARIKQAAGGNPGLQAMLSRPLLAGEIEAATRAVGAVEHYLASGEVPKEASAAAEFFDQVSLTAFKDMLTQAETEQLRAATLFSVPVPRPVLAAAGAAAAITEPERAIDRLVGLGLVDLYLAPGEAEEAAVDPLARPLVPALTEAQRTSLAAAVIGPLYTLWKDAGGGLLKDQRGLEAARLALLGQAPPEIVNAAALAGAFFLFRRVLDAESGLDLVVSSVAALDRAGATPDLHLLRIGADCAERLGKTDAQEMLIERGLQVENADPRARAMLLSAGASRFIQTGDIDRAEKLLHEAAAAFASLGDVRSRAVTMGRIADILQARGQLDEALKIRNEEELPVYERLGDVRERAVTMGRIADIRQARGQLDEALKIRNEEVLPAMDRLGDVHSRAATMGQIADILQARGQLDEALKIFNEEVLPAMDRLGDVRSRALTMGRIADILQTRGRLDEALKIRNEEELPVYERLGDVRERAVTMGKIADILQARGQLDEALKIRNEEELPVYERLGDVRERAVTMGKIADIRQARGQLDEALKIRNEEELPVYERLGDVRERAVTMGKIADILQTRGRLDEALKIRNEEELPVYQRLGDVRSHASTMGKIADNLQARGQLDEALAMHLERLPIAEAMGDAASIAHIKFSCASIRLRRGGWEKGEPQTILDELAESFAIARQMGRADAIANVGAQYGQRLALAGRPDESLRVLDEAAGAFETLNLGEDAAQVRAWQDQIREVGGAGTKQTEKGASTRADSVAVATTGPGLGDVLNLALGKWQSRAVQGRGAIFGAAGTRGLGVDPELEGLVRSMRTRSSGEPPVEALIHPMQRLFGTAIGVQAAQAIGNETRTLAALQRLSVEAMADALRLTGQVGRTERLLVMPGEGDRPPVLMLMSPKVGDVSQSRVISDELDLPLPVLWKAMQDVADLDETTPEAAALRQVLSGGPTAIAEIFVIARPEIVLTRLPHMIPLCVASPHMTIESAGKVSTAGVLCRDADGDLGVTACYHGTGPVGTEVTVDLQKSRVKRASEVQDIVFIPLGHGFAVPLIVGLSGALKDREPARADQVRFDGAINPNKQTRIFGTDNGLLRARPTVQLRLQTDPDTDQGDSGSALLDQNDCVLGFAFERTAYNDYPQFTDWIWAANALRALELTPYNPGD